MGFYDSLMRDVAHPSLESEQTEEGLRLDNEEGYREQGDVLITLSTKETDTQLISNTVVALEAAGYRVVLNYETSMEDGTHEPTNKIVLGQGYSDGVDNLVVNGVYIPDVVQAKPLRRVEVIHPSDVVRSNPGDLVFVPKPTSNDEHRLHIYDEATAFLRELGYRVVNTVDELISELG